MEVRKPNVFSRYTLILFAAFGACSGSIGPRDRDGQSPDDEQPGAIGGGSGGDEFVPPGQMPEAERCVALRGSTPTPVKTAMRRLSWQEIQNGLTDLFPETPPSEFEAQTEPAHLPSRMDAALELNESFIRAYRPALTTLTRRAAAALTSTGACKGAAIACLEGKLVSLARRAWRGTLNADDRTVLAAKLAAFSAEIGATAGYAAALELVLASPRFLFLMDPGSLMDDVGLDGVFIAKGERLAGLWAAAVWGSVPDDKLVDAAAAGALDDPDRRGVELDRLFSDSRARRGMSSFFRFWLHYNQIIKSVKNETLFPAFNDAVRSEMLADTESTLLELVFDANETPSSLLVSPLGTPGPKMVALLGWSENNVAPSRGDLTAVDRHGVATHPALLAVTSKTDATSIVNRGRFVVEKLACGHVPDPPKDVDIDAVNIEAQAAGETLTGRQLAERHATDPRCGGCHKLMDPFGIAFENYDPVGRVRTMDQGLPIDTSFELEDSLGITGKFNGAIELLDALAETGQVDRCFATSFTNFVMPAELTESQLCAITDQDGRLSSSQPPSMLEMAKDFLLSDIFVTRSTTL
jgi:Protein of unknown function (DUF1588)/Protein of unknown function (DUF1592)